MCRWWRLWQSAFHRERLRWSGPNLLTEGDRQTLAACGNVVLTGPVPYAGIPEIMRAFDVCITPHRVTPFTESLNPIKLWEYLAAGKPIVATNVAGFRDYPQMVRLASECADSFGAAVEAALTEPDATAGEARRTEARRHSWDSRLAQVLEVLGSAAAEESQAKGQCVSPEFSSPDTLNRPEVSVVIVSYNTRQMTLGLPGRTPSELERPEMPTCGSWTTLRRTAARMPSAPRFLKLMSLIIP